MYNKKLLFWAACSGMLVFGIVMISLGTINTFIVTKFNLNELTIGTLAALLPFGILIGSLIFGPIVDRYGYKILLIVSTTIIFIAIEGIAFTNDSLIIRISFFLIGFGGGIINGGTNALVSDISEESKGAKLSLLGVFYGIGALGMPIIFGILSKYFSYESILKGIGIFVLFPALFFSLISFPIPKQQQELPIKRGLGLLRDLTLLLMGFFLFFESGIEGVANNWTTTYLRRELLFSQGNSLYALSFLVLGLTLARLVLGWLLRKASSQIVMIICLCAAAIGTIILMFATNLVTAMTGLFIMGVGFSGGFPIILGYVGETYPKISGTAFSIVFVVALIGNTIINYLVGIISNSFGIAHYLTVILVSICVMIFLFSIIIKRIPAKIKS